MATLCCSALAAHLPLLVSYPNDTIYNSTEASYWSTQEALVAPACIVQPRTSADVSTFMSIVARETNCNFAIKSQGHAPAAGFANIDGGVTLDITTLNATIVSEDHQTAEVGPGSTWVDVYRSLQPYNKTVAGGRNGAVGVGGLTLGGGISYYSPQVGFTSDTVANFELVLPSGVIANGNSTSNSDLFKALKGGGNNFGIVTKITFKTVDTVSLFAGHFGVAACHAEDALSAFAGIVASQDYDVHASIVTSLTYNTTSKSWSVVSVPQYTLPEPNPPVYAELFSIPNITSRFAIQDISSLSAEPPYPQKYEMFFTSTYGASSRSDASALLIDVYHYLNDTLSMASPSQAPRDISWSLALEPLPSKFTIHSKGSIFGLNTTENAMLYLLSVSWSKDSSTAAANAMGQQLVKGMDSIAEKADLLRKFRYYNYADPSQDVLGSYGAENLEFLRGVSRKYDPVGVFQRKVPGGFKLWRRK